MSPEDRCLPEEGRKASELGGRVLCWDEGWRGGRGATCRGCWVREGILGREKLGEEARFW